MGEEQTVKPTNAGRRISERWSLDPLQTLRAASLSLLFAASPLFADGQQVDSQIGNGSGGEAQFLASPSAEEYAEDDQPRWSLRRSKAWPPNWFKKEDDAVPFENIVRDANGQWRVTTRPEDLADTNPEFQAAQELFRSEQYDKAASAYKRLAKAYKNKPLAEDALYMQAESLFKADRLPKAQDTYLKLMTDFPTTRYMPQAIQRTYDIAYYWLEDAQLRAQGQAGKYAWYNRYINFFDETRPILDTNGRAIEAIESIQNHDPFGPLTDDAVMMAGGYKFNNGSYLQSASYFEQLVADQPKSEHATKAYVLASEAYLRAYRGPQYDGQDLDATKRMTQAALTRAPALTNEERVRLEEKLRVIHLEQAKRDFHMAETYMRLRRRTAARMYFEKVVDKFPDTEYAKLSQEKLSYIAELESAPPGFFASLSNRINGWRDGEESVTPQTADAPTVEAATGQLIGEPGTETPVDSAAPRPASPGKYLGIPNPFGGE